MLGATEGDPLGCRDPLGSEDMLGFIEGCDDGCFDLNVFNIVGSVASDEMFEMLFNPVIGSSAKLF